jgi:DNA replication protein DnaC
VFRLPRSHWHCTLAGFTWAAARPASLQARVDAFLAAAADGGAPHLILTGDPGIGKTHLGVAAYRAATVWAGTALAYWCNVPAFCEAVKRGYKSDDASPWEDVEAARRLVVLDDLFGRDLSTHEASQIVYRLIDTVYTNGAACLITMNQAESELPARLAAHEISRLLAGATLIPMTAAKDWRRT